MRNPPRLSMKSAAAAMRCARMPQPRAARRQKWKSRASYDSSPAKCTLIIGLQVGVWFQHLVV